MPIHAKGTAQTGAKNIWSNVVSNGADWIETFEGSQNGAELPNADTSTWTILIKPCGGGSPVLTLTSGAQITVTQNTTSTIFAIDAPPPSSLCGDYEADLVEVTALGKRVHWCHGVITFIDENLGG